MSSLNSIDWNDISERLSAFATSPQAQDALTSIEPLSGPEAAKNSFRKIDELMQVVKSGQRPYMESLELFALWSQRLERQATLKPLELKDVRHFCIEAIACREVLRAFDSPWIQDSCKMIMAAGEPLSAIDQIMTPAGDIKIDASEKLYALNQEKKSQVKDVQNILDRIVKDQDMETVLQDRYVTNREGRWVLPVKSGMQHSFSGIIHASSHSKQTVFMEPQDIIPINNRLRQIEVEIEAEIERLLVQLSSYLASQAPEFQATKSVLLELDEYFAKAQLAVHMQGHPCEFSDSAIQLKNVRHPSLVLNNQGVVANTLELNEQHRILLLSGPNAGGKTVLLKSVGLAAHMARCGLLICADPDSRLPFFKEVFVAVGDAQSVDEHLSTFAAHLKVLNQAISASGPDSLILIDEICGSTDPEEGSALARSFIERYANSGSLGVITSHLGTLKLGWEEHSGVVNGSLEYDPETGPTYQFFMGIPGQSLAIQTARRVGVDSSVIEKAMEFLTPEHRAYQQTLDDVEAAKEEVSQLKKILVDERKSAHKLKDKYQALVKKFEKERSQMVDQALTRAERKIDKMIKFAKVDDTFKKHEQLEKIKMDLPSVVKAKSGSAAKTNIETGEDFAKAFPPGSKVFIPTVGRDGVIQSTPNSKGEVLVLSSSMRLTLPWDALQPAHKTSSQTREVLRHTKHFNVSPTDTDREIDLRGLRVEEALDRLDEQLDAASHAQEDRVKVIHGHGTDALKKAIRNFLSRSNYVKKWSAGNKNTGGDGITWAEL